MSTRGSYLNNYHQGNVLEALSFQLSHSGLLCPIQVLGCRDGATLCLTTSPIKIRRVELLGLLLVAPELMYAVATRRRSSGALEVHP